MKLLSKTLLLFGIFVLLLQSSCAIKSLTSQISGSNNYEDAILLTKQSFPVSSINEVKVVSSGGAISVTADAEQEVAIEMYVKSNKSGDFSKEEIQEILDRDYEIIIVERDGRLEAHARKKTNLSWINSLSISFKIRTGRQVSTDLSTKGGSIQLSGLSGNQKIETNGGSLKIEDLEGEIVGKTSGGSIEAYNSQGLINLTTSGGSINLENLNGNVFVFTSGGSIKGHSIVGTLVAETSGGSISLEDLSCKLDASTTGGSVTAVINKLTDNVQLSTSAGSVNLTLPINASADLNFKGLKINTESLTNFNGSNEKGKLLGKLNGGGKSIYASTTVGNVNLSFK